MNITRTLKDIFHQTDTSFDTVEDGHVTTPAEKADRGGWSLASRIACHIPGPDGSLRWRIDGADLTDFPPLILTMVDDLTAVPAERPAGRHYRQS